MKLSFKVIDTKLKQEIMEVSEELSRYQSGNSRVSYPLIVLNPWRRLFTEHLEITIVYSYPSCSSSNIIFFSLKSIPLHY